MHGDRKRRSLNFIVFSFALFVMQACSSTHYTVTSDFPPRIRNNVPSNATFSVSLDKSRLTGDEYDQLYLGIVSELNQQGIAPPGADGSLFGIEILPTSRGDGITFMSVVSLSLGAMTLGIIPITFPSNMSMEVVVKDMSDDAVVTQFDIQYRKSECLGMTPLAYLCVPNLSALGRKIGDQVATQIKNSDF